MELAENNRQAALALESDWQNVREVLVPLIYDEKEKTAAARLKKK